MPAGHVRAGARERPQTHGHRGFPILEIGIEVAANDRASGIVDRQTAVASRRVAVKDWRTPTRLRFGSMGAFLDGTRDQAIASESTQISLLVLAGEMFRLTRKKLSAS